MFNLEFLVIVSDVAIQSRATWSAFHLLQFQVESLLQYYLFTCALAPAHLSDTLTLAMTSLRSKLPLTPRIDHQRILALLLKLVDVDCCALIMCQSTWRGFIVDSIQRGTYTVRILATRLFSKVLMFWGSQSGRCRRVDSFIFLYSSIW